MKWLHVKGVQEDPYDPNLKVIKRENASAARRKADFLAKRDRAYREWCEANGVADRVVGVDEDTGVKTVVRGPVCIAAPSGFYDSRNALGALDLVQNRCETSAKQKAWSRKNTTRRRRTEKMLRERCVCTANTQHKKDVRNF
jgi:hypothetical protein